MRNSSSFHAFLIISLLIQSNFALSNGNSKSLTLTMTNDPSNNGIEVFDTDTQELLDILPTGGKGGVSGNDFGIKQYQNTLFAAVNYGSNTVSIFKRNENRLVYYTSLYTSSAPVSIDFGKNHIYVAGTTTVDSYAIRASAKGFHFDLDGTAILSLSDGGIPQVGNTSQVGIVQDHLLITLKSDPTPGTVDIAFLNEDGSLSGKLLPVPGPAGSLTPFGFSVLPDGSALITLAHSNQLGLFKNLSFIDVIDSASQKAPCWAARAGKYVYTVNAGSGTITRSVTTGDQIFIDAPIAATITSGGPTDIDQSKGKLVVLDHSATTSHLNFFSVNQTGDLATFGIPVDLNVPNANGVSIMSPETIN